MPLNLSPSFSVYICTSDDAPVIQRQAMVVNWRVRSNGMNVVVNGLMTSYEKSGSGKTVLCLHGWGDDSATFSQLTQKLSDNYEVLTLDLPGIGNTQASSDVWGLDNYAQFVKAWLQKIGIRDPYAVIGHSNGGAIAMRGLAKNLLRPQKIVLLASAGIRTNRKIRRKLLKVVAKTGKVLTSPLPRQTKVKIRNRFYKRIGSEIGLFPHMEATFRKIVTEDTQADAKDIKIPTLLIYGSRDKTTPARYGEIFNNHIKGSRLVTIDAGHFLHHEQPAAVAKLIENFLAENHD